MKIYIVWSHKDLHNPTDFEIEMVTACETDAEEFAHEMDDCDASGRWYTMEEWEVS